MEYVGRVLPGLMLAFLMLSPALGQPVTTGAAKPVTPSPAPQAPPAVAVAPPPAASISGAAAPNTGSAAPAPSADASKTASAADCSKPMPTHAPPGNFQVQANIDEGSLWRPIGGQVSFTVSGSGFSAANSDIATCMRWSGYAGNFVPTSSLRLTDNSDPHAVSFVATVPGALGDAPHNWFYRITHTVPTDSATALEMVPLADFRIIARTPNGGGWQELDIVQPVGITTTGFAATFAGALVVLTWFGLYLVARARGVPGKSNFILRVIATKSGYASLSQLQIILWAIVIGASTAYVMVLSGSLVPITGGILTLLGIGAGATVVAKLQGQTGATLPSTPPAPPGAVESVYAGPCGDSEVRVAWTLPSNGFANSYGVQYRPQTPGNAGDWLLSARGITGTAHRIVGLAAATPYDIRVIATNAGGDGPPLAIQATTAAMRPGIGPVLNFGPAPDIGNTWMRVSWTPLATATGYIVQHRAHDGDDDWRNAVVTGEAAVITGLDALTEYDFRLAATASPPPLTLLDYGPWTYFTGATTGPRLPIWTDLFITADSPTEIDITRVQMLFFTLIVATFVVMRVLTSGTIPEISQGYLVLMGISNGVYLGSKFIPNPNA
jgi:hypothetical protein